MVERKQSKWVARASRMMELFNKQALTQEQTKEKDRLFKRLRIQNRKHQNPNSLSLWLQQQIQHIQHEQTKDQQQRKRQGIQQWQEKMRTNQTDRFKWVRNNYQPLPQVTHKQQVQHSESMTIQAIREHWHNTWQPVSKQTIKNRIEFIKQNIPQHQHITHRPTEGEFLSTHTKIKGTHGPDFWTAEEIQAFPPQICTMFCNITETWEKHGKIPSGLTYSRQINLPKPGKVTQGTTQVADLRPITIYSLWYRWWSSTWAKSSVVRKWRAERFPQNIIGGAGSPGTEQLASQLCDDLQHYGFLGSLDYSQCYDHVHPSLATAALKQLGLPQGLTQVLHFQWMRQKRYLSWNNYVDPTPLRSSESIPQGDPLSPLALNAIMLAGFNYTQRSYITEERCTQMIYMDDRTIIATSAQQLLNTIDAWQQFSTAIALKENQNKLQITYHTNQQKTRLLQQLQSRPHLHNKVTNTATILGVCTTGSKQRQLTPKETQRFDQAITTCNKIKALPTNHNIKMDTARATAVSKAAYGWVAKSPPKNKQTELNKAIRATSTAFKAASPHMYRMLTGGNKILEVVIGVRQTLLMATRYHSEQRTPQYMNTSILYKEAKQFLQNTGWQQQQANHLWHHPELRTSWNLRHMHDKEARKHLAHLLREAWRCVQWKQFQNSSRRDAAMFHEIPYDSHRVQAAREATGKAAGATLSILLGAAISPAAYKARKDISPHIQQGLCTHCQKALGTHNHMFWVCRQRPQQLKDVLPADIFQKRFGWPRPTDGNEVITAHNMKILAAMTHTVELIWTQRHAHSGKKYVARGFKFHKFAKNKKGRKKKEAQHWHGDVRSRMNSTGRVNPATKVPERSGTKVLCGRTYSISTRLFFFVYIHRFVFTYWPPSMVSSIRCEMPLAPSAKVRLAWCSCGHGVDRKTKSVEKGPACISTLKFWSQNMELFRIPFRGNWQETN